MKRITASKSVFSALTSLLFLFSCLSSTLLEAPFLSTNGAHTNHHDGSSCPDPEESGDPCGPFCTCTCCPGHTIAVILQLHEEPFIVMDVETMSEFRDHGRHSQSVYSRIFKPPRA